MLSSMNYKKWMQWEANKSASLPSTITAEIDWGRLPMATGPSCVSAAPGHPMRHASCSMLDIMVQEPKADPCVDNPISPAGAVANGSRAESRSLRRASAQASDRCRWQGIQCGTQAARCWTSRTHRDEQRDRSCLQEGFAAEAYITTSFKRITDAGRKAMEESVPRSPRLGRGSQQPDLACGCRGKWFKSRKPIPASTTRSRLRLSVAVKSKLLLTCGAVKSIIRVDSGGLPRGSRPCAPADGSLASCSPCADGYPGVIPTH